MGRLDRMFVMFIAFLELYSTPCAAVFVLSRMIDVYFNLNETNFSNLFAEEFVFGFCHFVAIQVQYLFMSSILGQVWLFEESRCSRSPTGSPQILEECCRVLS